MADWREQLSKLARARGTKRFPLLVFSVAPSSGRPWPQSLPCCQGMRDFYNLCDGGKFPPDQWYSVTEIESKTEHWRENLCGYYGDDRSILQAGRHVVLANDSAGAPLIWDAEADRMATFFWKGGDWEPYNLSFEEFINALFFAPLHVGATDLWNEALKQLAEEGSEGHR